MTTSTASRASVTPITTALSANTPSQRHSYRRRFPALRSPIRGLRRRIRPLQPDVMSQPPQKLPHPDETSHTPRKLQQPDVTSQPPQRLPPGTTTHVTQLVVARTLTGSKETEQMYVLVAVCFFFCDRGCVVIVSELFSPLPRHSKNKFKNLRGHTCPEAPWVYIRTAYLQNMNTFTEYDDPNLILH